MISTVLVHEDETGGYWGECLELPGCVSQGETLDEMDRHIREAIALVLEVKLEDGENLSNLKAGAPALGDDPSVRRWQIHVALPEPSSVR
jgi:predicted RNase H-like HicB family nuclease